MDDNKKLQELFKGFNPRLGSSSDAFMATLQRNMAAVESIRAQCETIKRRSRRAVVLAAAAGFVAGVVMTLLFPYISAFIAGITITLPQLNIASLTFDPSITTWAIVAATSIVAALTTYDLASSALRPAPAR